MTARATQYVARQLKQLLATYVDGVTEETLNLQLLGGKLKLEGTVMVRSGNALQFTGKETKGTPLSMLGFNLEDTITVGATPRDPADVDKAMELV